MLLSLAGGGQYILHDFENTCNILLIANEEDKIKFIVDHYRVSRTRAVQMINRMNKRRANLYSFFRKKDYDDPKLYDLILNMSRFSIDKAEKLITMLIND
jgi:cytidylate kinase